MILCPKFTVMDRGSDTPMSKIICSCGCVIPDISDHQSFKGYILSDKELFPLYDFADEMIESPHPDKEELCMTFRREVGGGYIRLKRVYQCFECGRLLIEDENGEFTVFAPEGHSNTRVLDFSKGERSGIVKRRNSKGQ